MTIHQVTAERGITTMRLRAEAALQAGQAADSARRSRASRGHMRSGAPDAVRQSILWAAAGVFAEKGLNGARIDEIARLSHFSKMALYYHFKSKEGLYAAVLTEAYRLIRDTETKLRLEEYAPPETLARLVAHTFDHHARNEDFIRLVMVENIHFARNISGIREIVEINSSAIDQIAQICARGAKDGSLREDLDPLQLHVSISALCFFNVSNRHTIRALFDYDVTREGVHEVRKREVVSMILAHATRTTKP